MRLEDSPVAGAQTLQRALYGEKTAQPWLCDAAGIRLPKRAVAGEPPRIMRPIDVVDEYKPRPSRSTDWQTMAAIRGHVAQRVALPDAIHDRGDAAGW